MAYYIKDIIKLARLDFKEAINEVLKVNPKFKVTGGPQAEIDFETFKATCQNNSIEVDDDGRITVYRDTNEPGNVVKFAPTTSAKPEVQKLSYNDLTLDEFNKLKAEKVDPLKVRAEMSQIPDSLEVVTTFLKSIRKEKTILNDALIHDTSYLKALFQKYPYILCPVQLGRRIRKQLEPSFIKMYLTDEFNNKIIAFNSDKAIYAYIINA